MQQSFDNKTTFTTLLCHQHILYYILSRLTLRIQLGKIKKDALDYLEFQVIGDRSLRKSDVTLIHFFFPHTKIYFSQKADEVVVKELKKYPLLLSLRKNSKQPYFNYLRKILDCHFLSKTEKVIILDADVIFFHPPQEIFSWIKNKKSKSSTLMFTFQKKFTDYFEKANGEQSWQKKFQSLRKINRNVGTYNAGIVAYNKHTFALEKYQRIVQKILRIKLSHFSMFDDAALPFAFPHIKGLPKETYFVLDYMEDRHHYFHKSMIACHYSRENKRKIFTDVLRSIFIYF